MVTATGLVPQSYYGLGLASADASPLMLCERSCLDMYLHLPVTTAPAPSLVFCGSILPLLDHTHSQAGNVMWSLAVSNANY